MGDRVRMVDVASYDPASTAELESAGRRLDAEVVALVGGCLPFGERVAVRALSMRDHPGLSASGLAEVILRTGTDRYDDGRAQVLADVYDPWGVELHAIGCRVGTTGQLVSEHYGDGSVLGGLLGDFYQGPPVDRDCAPMRIDVVTVYDVAQLDVVPVEYDGVVEAEPTSFRFRSPDRAAEAVVGVLVLRHGR